MEEKEYSGVVKFYNMKAKFGFIKIDQTEEEVYVKKSGLIDPVEEGDLVTLSLETHPKGSIAVNVSKKNA